MPPAFGARYAAAGHDEFQAMIDAVDAAQQQMAAGIHAGLQRLGISRWSC